LEKKFQKYFEQSVKNHGESLTEKQAGLLMKRWPQERKRYEWVLEEAFRKALTNEDEELAPNIIALSIQQ